MGVVSELLSGVPLPKMMPIRQIFADGAIRNVEAALRAEISAPAVSNSILAGMNIAIGVGSRGMAELPLLVRTVVSEIASRKAHPFIVPAMGSHGGATAQGQIDLLASLGVTDASAGCPIRSSMETVELGQLANGLPVHMDKNSMEADGIVVINRIKPHTSFSGRIESGLTKMITIGLGKQKGADACHSRGFGTMAENIVGMAKIKLEKASILFGVATVENSYDLICNVAAIPATQILEREQELLREARDKMPRIRFDPLDVLVIDKMGKEYSGTGMDPNITGRAQTPFVKPSLSVSKMVVLDLSEKSRGNATGLGLADVCTKRLFQKIDLDATYINHITSTVLMGAKIPPIMDTDKLAVQAAVKTCNAKDPERLRIARIANTLHLDRLWLSEALHDEAASQSDIEILGEPEEWKFDSTDTLEPL